MASEHVSAMSVKLPTFWQADPVKSSERELHLKINQLWEDVKKLLEISAVTLSKPCIPQKYDRPTLSPSHHLCWYHFRFGEPTQKCKLPCLLVPWRKTSRPGANGGKRSWPTSS